MTPQGKNALIIGGLFAGATAIGLIWYYTGESNRKNAPCPGSNMHKDENGNCILNTPQTPPPPVVVLPPAVNTSTNQPTDILAFQQFANANGWLPELTYDGWGPKTAAAWLMLKDEYLKPKVVVTPPPTSPIKKLDDFRLGEKLYANDNNAITNVYKTSAVSAGNIFKSFRPNYFVGTYLETVGSMISLAVPVVGAFGTSYKQAYALKGNIFGIK